MWVLHAHWQPPRQPVDQGGIVFWAETPDMSAPVRRPGRGPQKIKPRPHPFILPTAELRQRAGAGTPLEDARVEPFLLLLPGSIYAPLPSPELNPPWELEQRRAILVPWIIEGLQVSPAQAFSLLTNLPLESREGGFTLGQDARYWRMVCSLVLETLAAQKLLPVMIPMTPNGNGQSEQYLARWQPVLDGPNDGQRLAQLAAAMPPVCLGESRRGRRSNGSANPARILLDSFVNAVCDNLARSWGRARAPILTKEEPTERWLAALFDKDPRVRLSAGQAQALYSRLRAWMRNLYAAGDSVLRIAFQVEAPPPGDDPRKPVGDWTVHYLLQGRDDPSLLIPALEVWQKQSNALGQLGQRIQNPEEKLLAGLGYAARIFPPILDSLRARHPVNLQIPTMYAYQFLREAAPLLEQAGFGVFVPSWWQQKGGRLGVRLNLKTQESKSGLPGKLGLNTLIDYRWDLSLGNTTLTREEFESLAALKTPLVQVRGQWVQLDEEQIEAAIRFWEAQQQSGQMPLLEATRLALGGAEPGGLPVDDVTSEGWISDWLGQLGEHERMSELPQPGGLLGVLRPYQRFGYSWLAFFRRWGVGACLADDMGLGKTIQALALLLYEKESLGKLPGPTLLIAPTSVVINWEREARRFAPALKVMVHQGPDRPRGEDIPAAYRKADLVLTSYALLRMDAEWLHKIKWYGAILDEAQNIKNPSARQTQAANKLNAGFRFALTGTPVENRLSELWSIMQFLNPGFLGSRERFQRNYGIPIERFGDPDATRALKQLIGPFILRRVKTDPRVITDLPEKIEGKEFCRLSEEQATLYQAVVNDSLRKVAESDGMERRGLVLSMLMQLKQICNHPAQFLHEQNKEMPGERLLSGRSGKLIRLQEILEEILAEGDRVLVYTQFAEMGKLLAEELPRALGCRTQFLYGETPARMRDQMVERFQEEEDGPSVFILSLKAGGVGLNLTRANHVIHFDRWWNPAVEDQATDRAFRIGQMRSVQVHKFITAGTLEERIDEMIESKKGLVQSVIGSGEQWLTEFSTDELRQLVALR